MLTLPTQEAHGPLYRAALALRDTGGTECTAEFRRHATPSAIIRLVEENKKLSATVKKQDEELQERWP